MREKGAKTSKLFMRTTLSLTKNCCNATLFDEFTRVFIRVQETGKSIRGYSCHSVVME